MWQRLESRRQKLTTNCTQEGHMMDNFENAFLGLCFVNQLTLNMIHICMNDDVVFQLVFLLDDWLQIFK